MEVSFKIIIYIIAFICFQNLIACDPDFSNIDVDEDKNVCIGGQSYSTASDQLQAFKESPCHPMVTLTGIMASKIYAFIYDCDLLPDDVLENCNIMTQKNKDRFIWKPSFDYIKCKSNQSEFLLYPAFDPLDPTSFEFGGKCFNTLAGTDISYLNSYNVTDFPYTIPDVPGIKVTWFGNTPGTFQESNCGLTATQDFGPGEMKYYEFMSQYFIDMGYQVGLSYFPVPYDWRRMQGSTELTIALERTVKWAYELTGKKVIIMAHSYGTMGAAEALYQMDQTVKDQFVERFVAICGPLAGAAQMAGDLLMGTTQKFYGIGYNLSDFREPITSLSSIYDLMPKSIFTEEKDQPWAQVLQTRLQQEAQWKQGGEIEFNWYPSPDKTCYSSRSDNQNCGLHFYNYFDNPIYTTSGQLNESNYYCNYSDYSTIGALYGLRNKYELDFIKLMQQVNLTEQQQEAVWGIKQLIPKDRIDIMINMSRRNVLYQENNINVPVTAIFSQMNQTQALFKIKQNPRLISNQGMLSFQVNIHLIGESNFSPDYIDIVNWYGDSLVNVDFSLTPIMKWAWEFDQRVNNSYPMQLIDYCSEYSEILYKNNDNKYTMNYTKPINNTYSGMPCAGLIHETILMDQYLIKVVASIAKSGNKPSQVPAQIEQDIVQMILNTCPNLYAPYQAQNVSELISYAQNASHAYPNKTDFNMYFGQPTVDFIQFLEESYNSLQSNTTQTSEISTKG